MSDADPAGDGHGWRVVGRRRLVDDVWLRVDRESIRLPDGRTLDGYFVVHQRHFAIVFPVTAAGEVVLVRQYKHGIGQTTLELPAGYIEPADPAPAAAVVRELAEETGYTPADIQPLGALICDPTRSPQRGHVFLATGCRLTGGQRLDPAERIEVVLAPLARLQALVTDGEIAVQSSIAAIFLGLAALRADAASAAPGPTG
ncbi:MAG: NUDIX hydrolase [Chloroflexi bacterium]|nr:NUDIX hydrolase [Chloroflexota bacterium]